MDIDTSQEFSEPETQFVPQEDDEDTLWEVIEITAEKGAQYRVKWAGLDPKTNKPWPQSWVQKHDCTPDLVQTWKRKQRRKLTASGKTASRASSSKTTTVSPAKSLANAIASTSASASISPSRTRKPKHRSNSASISVATVRPRKTSPIIPDPEWDSPPKSKVRLVVELQESARKRKRKSEVDHVVPRSDADEPESELVQKRHIAETSLRRKRKRKYEVDSNVSRSDADESESELVEKGTGSRHMSKSKSNSKSKHHLDERDVHPPAKKLRVGGTSNGISPMARQYWSDFSDDEDDEDKETRRKTLGTISNTKSTAKKTAAPARSSSATVRVGASKANDNGKEKGKGKDKGKGKAKAKLDVSDDEFEPEPELVESGNEDGDEDEEQSKEVNDAKGGQLRGGYPLRGGGSSGVAVRDNGKGKNKASSVQAKDKEKPLFILSPDSSHEEDEIEGSERGPVKAGLLGVEGVEFMNDEPRGGTREPVDEEDDDEEDEEVRENVVREPLKKPNKERARGSSSSNSRQPGTKTERVKKVAVAPRIPPAPASSADEDGPDNATTSIPAKQNPKTAPAPTKLAASRKTVVPTPQNAENELRDRNAPSELKSKSPPTIDPGDRDDQTARSKTASRAALPREPNKNGHTGEFTLNPKSALTRGSSRSSVNETTPANGDPTAGPSTSKSNSNVGSSKPNSGSRASRASRARSNSPQPGSSSTTRTNVPPRKEFLSSSVSIRNSEDERLRLSPNARARLKEFDDFLASLPPDEEPRRGDQHRQQQQQDDDSAELQYPDAEPDISQDQDGDVKALPPQPKQHSQGSESFVPETEASNNTQQSMPQSSPAEPEPKPEPEPQSDDERIATPPPPPPPPQRSPNSIIAKMKPRTPSKKDLRPILVVTPSTFVPFLSRPKPTAAAGNNSAAQGDSIEQWSSPEKSTIAVRGSQVSANTNPNRLTVTTGDSNWARLNPSQDSEALEDEIRQRGIEMAQEARRKKMERVNGGVSMKKKTLDEIIASGKGKQIFQLPLLVATKQPLAEPVPEPESEQAEVPVMDASMDVDNAEVVESSVPSLEYPPAASNDAPTAIQPPEHRSSSKPPNEGTVKVPPSTTIRKSASPPSIIPAAPVISIGEWNEKIFKLESIVNTQRAEVEDLRRNNEAYLLEIASLKEALAAATASTESTTRGRQEAEKKAEALTQSLATAVAAKADAEKDKEFVREQYAKASGFAATTRAENEVLEKRAQIAESQAKEGVAMIKATYERRIKELEEDAKIWKQMGNWAMKKDMETNDDIRRRAAEEPELRRENDHLRRAVRDLKDQVKGLHKETQALEAEIKEKEDQRNAAAAQVEQWKSEVARMTIELNEKQAIPSTSFSTGDLVYRCHVRETDDSPSCAFVCRTKKELEDHVIRHTVFE